MAPTKAGTKWSVESSGHFWQLKMFIIVVFWRCNRLGQKFCGTVCSNFLAIGLLHVFGFDPWNVAHIVWLVFISVNGLVRAWSTKFVGVWKLFLTVCLNFKNCVLPKPLQYSFCEQKIWFDWIWAANVYSRLIGLHEENASKRAIC